MNNELSNSSKCFGLYNEQNEIVGFCAVLHQPHNKILNLKRVHRIVILPDYQGIGLGTKFLNIVAEYVTKQGNEFCIVTSAKNMIGALYKSDKWFCTSYRKSDLNKHLVHSNKTCRVTCACGRFMYKTNSYI